MKSSRPRPAQPSLARGDTEGGTVVGSVQNAIRIMRHLSTVETGMRTSHIAKALEINPSTCFNILRTLAREDLVHFDPEAKTYSLGLGLTYLARSVTAGEARMAEPMMERVAREYGITVSLWRRVAQDRMMLTCIVESPTHFRIRMNVGQRLPLLHGSMGRLMALHAGLSKSELRQQFRAVRWATPLSFQAFMEQAEDARERGWAIDDGYVARGVTGLSVPVFDHMGHASMACSATFFGGQHSADVLSKLAGSMAGIAERLSGLQGARRGSAQESEITPTDRMADARRKPPGAGSQEKR